MDQQEIINTEGERNFLVIENSPMASLVDIPLQ
jgi:hypothetical protein